MSIKFIKAVMGTTAAGHIKVFEVGTVASKEDLAKGLVDSYLKAGVAEKYEPKKSKASSKKVSKKSPKKAEEKKEEVKEEVAEEKGE